eukprot:5323079-Pyramimonas_sp.AAC.1
MVPWPAPSLLASRPTRWSVPLLAARWSGLRRLTADEKKFRDAPPPPPLPPPPPPPPPAPRGPL